MFFKRGLRLAAFSVVFITIFPQHSFTVDLEGRSMSLDPITFAGLIFFFIPSDEVIEDIDFRNIWFTVESNWITTNQREMGMGITLRGDRVSFLTRYRWFANRDRQSGFFWGLNGIIEWRRMYWFYGENYDINIGWSFPFREQGDVYHSIGINAGVDIGVRFRRNNFGITPFFGLGIPLFFLFGSLPSSIDFWEFYRMNMIARTIRAGIRLDFFHPGIR